MCSQVVRSHVEDHKLGHKRDQKKTPRSISNEGIQTMEGKRFLFFKQNGELLETLQEIKLFTNHRKIVMYPNVNGRKMENGLFGK